MSLALNPPLREWSGRVVWLVGASSGIGRALAAALDRAGARVIVSARQQALLDDFLREHASAQAIALDVLDAPALRHLDINYVGALNLLDALLPQLLLQARQGSPAHLSLVSSVAGYRGLPKSLGYGPSKAALTHLAEALYLDLSPERVGVSVINPGFVATPMTARNDFHMPALLTPEQAAQSILAGWARGEFEIHFPKRFTRWLKLLRHLSYGLYFRAVKRATR